jgi:uncharacterized protein YndB with AHSA1/START domain
MRIEMDEKMAPADLVAACDFPDPHTVVFRRELPHNVERVWSAITDVDEIARWFIAPAEIDLRPGGRYQFSHIFEGTLGAVEPPRLIEFLDPSGPGGGWRYELEPSATGCVMVFTAWLAPDAVWTHDPEPGTDQPFGPGTWWPGGLVGWHGFWDALRWALDDPTGRYPPEVLAEHPTMDAMQNKQLVADYRELMKRSPTFPS